MRGKNIIICAILFVIVSLAGISCKKEAPSCGTKCAAITINGIIEDGVTGSAIENIPVELTWFLNSLCIGCTSYSVGKLQSGADGKFSIVSNIDTSFFKDYHLTLRIPRDTNYIILPVEGGVNYAEYRYYNYNEIVNQVQVFEYFTQANLTIKLNRSLSDNFDFFSVDHQFSSQFGYGDIVITGHQSAKDSVLQVKTAADLFTKIYWKKTLINGPLIENRDSLICSKTEPNIFEINY